MEPGARMLVNKAYAAKSEVVWSSTTKRPLPPAAVTARTMLPCAAAATTSWLQSWTLAWT
jgi:hypothetical protein